MRLDQTRRSLIALLVMCGPYLLPGENGIKTVLAQRSPNQFDPSVKALSRSQVGETIEDGVGFGRIQIGSKESDLFSKWGSTKAGPNSSGKVYLYSLETSALLLVQVKNGQVDWIAFVFNVFGSPPWIKSTKGVKLGSSPEEVKTAYGEPGYQKGYAMLYRSQGIGFYIENNKFVFEIVVFKPGALNEFPTIGR